MRRVFVLVVCFVAALAAGFLAGVAYSSWRPPRRAGFMTRELGLSDEQAEAMKAILDEAAGERRRIYHDGMEAAKNHRIEAVKALVGESSAAAYEQILAAEKAEYDAVRQRSAEVFDTAVEKTMAILDQSQREKYAKFIAERSERREKRRGVEQEGTAQGLQEGQKDSGE